MSPIPAEAPRDAITTAITAWYRAHPERLGESIIAVQAGIFAIWKKEKRYPFSVPTAIDNFPGEAWRELHDEHAEIIAGFVACQGETLHEPVSTPVGTLLKRVNDYFGTHPSDPAGMDDRRREVPISTAILLAEGRHPPAPPKVGGRH